MCVVHSGQLPRVKAAAVDRVEQARAHLVDLAPQAVDVLAELIDGTRLAPEAVRVKAAVEVLARAGIRPGVDIVQVPAAQDPSEVLRARLEAIAERLAQKSTAAPEESNAEAAP